MEHSSSSDSPTYELLAKLLTQVQELTSRVDHLTEVIESAPSTPLIDVEVDIHAIDTIRKAAVILGKSEKTLHRWIARCPAHLITRSHSGRVMWESEDSLREWWRSRMTWARSLTSPSLEKTVKKKKSKKTPKKKSKGDGVRSGSLLARVLAD